jgi:hypothetical protein
MHVDVNGIRLWFDVDGPGLVPKGPEMCERPTVVLLHGRSWELRPLLFQARLHAPVPGSAGDLPGPARTWSFRMG